MLNKQVNFIVDSQGHRVAAVVPIDIFDELMTLQKALMSTKPNEREMYRFLVKDAEASGYPVGQRYKPGFMIAQGSTATLEQAGSLRQAVIDLRNNLLVKGVLVRTNNCYLFTDDYLFNSPSLAASLIAGNNRSGLDAWSNDTGFTLKQSGYGKK
ncbi:MAG: DUF4357 domain-containing protein [Tolumonas sp.]|uniref:DUF4357 domain-containing protein n=1 Tax=uncultured Tolumonas sp. TaxID=263765 RepID=UPI002A0A6C99|nr:DUF4357 domain-containing protein [uncultured Tolumonas sp.]MDD2343928.1 DUF4357 domain-containing protein [Tolumonas sp.]MDD2842174.1 DUF4357 domain-containing protein [Tolumonas sp.]